MDCFGALIQNPTFFSKLRSFLRHHLILPLLNGLFTMTSSASLLVSTSTIPCSRQRWRLELGLPPLGSGENSLFRRKKIGLLQRNGSLMRLSLHVHSFPKGDLGKDVFLVRKGRNKGSLVVVRANQQFGFNGGGGGGGGWDSRVLGNLALAIGLTYLTMTGQLGWLLDAIVSLWLLAVLIPIIGFGAFFWFASQQIVQSNCPSCGNEFQILKSSMKDGPQLCPFCSEPFSVQDNNFVRESTRFSSDRSTNYGQAFNGFSPRVEKGKTSSTAVVDIEAEVKDID